MNQQSTQAMSKSSKCTATQKFRAQLRKGKGSMASLAKAERLAALEKRAFEWIARGREANVELGRVFLQLKKIIGHGRWQRYYFKRFGSCGIAKRTAQTYMQMARKEDANSKTAESALFPTARDPQAQTVRAATERAQAEVGEPSGHMLRKENNRLEGTCLYKLRPIHLGNDERDACNELVKSHWSRTEKEIVALLKRLCTECGVVQRGRP